MKNHHLKNKNLYLECLIALLATASLYAVTPAWNNYLTAKQNEQPTFLRDYSYTGYHQCERSLPQVSDNHYTVFDVRDYGAIPNDGQSDRVAIQQAIDAASSQGQPAMVFLPPGRFRISEPSDIGQTPLTIRKHSIVLKGSGIEQTELYCAEPLMHGSPAHVYFTSNRPSDYYWRGGKKIAKLISYPAPGGFTVEVDNTSQLRAGMFVNIDADLNVNTQRGRDYFEAYMPPHDTPQGVKDRKDGKNDYLFEMHRIKSIRGQQVTFSEPIHLDLPHLENAVLWSIDHIIEESGIEDLTLCGNYREQFKHHSGSRHGEDFRMLRFDDAVNCWARNLRIVDYSVGIRVWRSAFSSFFNITLQGNAGHNPITVTHSYGNLFAFCREVNEGHHGFGGAGAAANTVFLRCNQFESLEAHCGWIRASLYDLNQGGFKPRPGGAKVFPHHGKGLCFWNWDVTRSSTKDFWPIGSSYGYFMPPVIVGLHGVPFTVEDVATDIRLMESEGTRVEPPSLFEAQLALRLGNMPNWLEQQSDAFEKTTRYAEITIDSPAAHSVLSLRGRNSVQMSLPAEMDTNQIQRTELWTSTESLHEGFTKHRSINTWSSQLPFIPDHTGTWVLKARIINTHNMVTESRPVVIYVGDAEALQNLPITHAAFLPHSERTALYSHFVARGGGESTHFKDYDAMQAFYQDYGQEHVKPLLERADLVKAANSLIDNNEQTTCSQIYGYIGAMAQFDLGMEQSVSRLDLVWTHARERGAKLEVQTSSDALAWYSVVNDEPRWEFGRARIGSTLQRNLLPGSGRISQIFLPSTNCRYVRLLMQSFPNNELAEVKIYGQVLPR